MSQYRVSSSGSIAARASRVYAAIADYKEQHPHILPPEYFRRLEVLEGGVGAGTRTRVEMRVLGSTRVFEQIVTEPEPGRVIMESNQDGSGVTTFTVDATGSGESAQVTISTDVTSRPGIAGRLERFVVARMLPRIYRKEIAQMAEYLSREGAGRPGRD
jgi:Polyketide cyclase / dehydrase and lipid transport